MESAQYLKSVRTRYLNILKKEILCGKDILKEDMCYTDSKQLGMRVNKCLKKLQEYSTKLQDQSAKLASIVGEKEPEFIESIADETCEICDESFDICCSLQQLEQEALDSTQVRSQTQEDQRKMTSTQADMQKMFELQMKLQEQFFERQAEMKYGQSTGFKLPKIDIMPFNGNKLKWTEFWDSFESAVDNNSNIPNIEKFNYLRNKLTGEARSSIEGLTLSNDNYKVALKILHARYGNKQEIIDLHNNTFKWIYLPHKTTPTV
jgi:hypothetical protein